MTRRLAALLLLLGLTVAAGWMLRDRRISTRLPPGELFVTERASGAPADDDARLVAARREVVRRRLRESGAATYLDSLLISTDSTLRRWPDPVSRSLRVAIIEGGPDGYSPHFADLFREALGRWDYPGSMPRLLLAADTAGAEIVVRWIDRFPNERTGQTDLTWNQLGRINRAVVTLAVRDRYGTPLTDRALLSVAVHEVGHALGLPHSADPADVMYPEPRTTQPSARDAATASLLYQLPGGSVKDGGP